MKETKYTYEMSGVECVIDILKNQPLHFWVSAFLMVLGICVVISVMVVENCDNMDIPEVIVQGCNSTLNFIHGQTVNITCIAMIICIVLGIGVMAIMNW